MFKTLHPSLKGMMIVSLFYLLSAEKSLSQEKPNNDIWYAWIDTPVNNGQTRVVGDIFVINCCVKSPKYRKLVKRAEKWIKKNIDEAYTGEDPLKKIQDEQLARTMIERARSATNVKLVSYTGSCP